MPDDRSAMILHRSAGSAESKGPTRSRRAPEILVIDRAPVPSSRHHHEWLVYTPAGVMIDASRYSQACTEADALARFPYVQGAYAVPVI